MLRLNVGTINKKEGYVNIDVRDELIYDPELNKCVPIDVVSDARNLPYKNGEVDEVYSDQMLEHLGRFEYMEALEEWYRVLKVGGKLDLAVPDLRAICIDFLEHSEKRRGLLQFFYGGQGFNTDYHKTGFTLDILREDLKEIGFRKVSLVSEKALLVRIEARK